MLDETRTWKDLAWLKSITKLPIIAKGIMNPEDAVLAWKHGASAIIVSNHGGRNIDTVPATVSDICLVNYVGLWEKFPNEYI